MDIETLQYVKSMFDIQSDSSAHCNGYRSLCNKIEEMTNPHDSATIVSVAQHGSYLRITLNRALKISLKEMVTDGATEGRVIMIDRFNNIDVAPMYEMGFVIGMHFPVGSEIKQYKFAKQ